MNWSERSRDNALRTHLLRNVRNFTSYFFSEAYKSDFVFAEPHKIIADALMEVVSGKCNRLIINVPPRYGKTELAVKHFIAYGLTREPTANFIHLSYSASLSEDNSVAIKDIMQLDEYRRLFPLSAIKKGADTKTKWETECGGGVYATSTLGQITGFGAGLMNNDGFGGAIIIDDPIKPEDAFSDVEREKVNRRFETTIRSRVNSRETPIIIIMQRLHENDLCGYLTKAEPGVWKVVKIPAILNDESGQERPLWEYKHTLEELHELRRINPMVFETQYMQNPTPLEGLLYNPNGWKTYSEIPVTARAVRKNYTDTADTGADNLVSVDYVETEQGNYILDMIVSSAPMETTEPMVARMLTKDEIELANIESNNGGRGFARNVEKNLRLLGNDKTRVEWFHQSANKISRIFTNSAQLQNLTFFPENWKILYPKAWSELSGFMKAGKNQHDDVEDALTGTIEKRGADGITLYDEDKTGSGTGVVLLLPDLTFFARGIVEDGKHYITAAGKELPESTDFAEDDTLVCYVSDVRRQDYMQLHDIFPNVRGAKFKGNAGGIIDQYNGFLQNLCFSREKVSSDFLNDYRETDGRNTYGAALCLCLLLERMQREIF